MTPPTYILIGGKRVVADQWVDPTDGQTYYQAVEKLAIGPNAGTEITTANPMPVSDAGLAALQTVLSAFETAQHTDMASLQAVLSAFQAADHTDLASLLTTLTAFEGADHTDLAAILAALGPLATQTTLAAVNTALGHLTDGTARIGGTVTTAPTGAGDVATALTDGRKTVTPHGTAVPLVAASTPCKWVQVTALSSNSTLVFVGGADVVAAAGAETGTPLAASGSTTFPVADVHTVYVDSRVDGEGVTFTWGA